MKHTIGFVMASIHQGSSSGMWQELISSDPASGDSAFIVFPGGRLSHKAEGEYLRNSIYDYVNEDNLDAAVCWISSLSGSCSAKELESMVDKFSRLPFVSIGQSVPGLPSVWFDAYGGMYAEVSHFITVHKARRIAFLRGPENHKSANDRYQAYVDCLSASGISFDAALVSSPLAWSDGKKGVLELMDERGLVPGRDFEVLISASDYMLSTAVDELIKRGVEIPETLKVAGFNDNDGIYLMNAAPTTVRMPIASMVGVSLSIIHDRLEGGATSVPEVNLPSELVVRRSCGCRDSFGGEVMASRQLTGFDTFTSWLKNRIQAKEGKKATEEYFSLYEKMDKGSLDVDIPLLDRVGDKYFRILFEAGCQIGLLLEAFSWLSRLILKKQELINYVYAVAIPSASVINERRQGKLEFESSRRSLLLTAFKNELLRVRSFDSLSTLMENHLRRLGYESVYLVLYGREGNRLVGGYDESGILSPESFSGTLLLPGERAAALKPGLLVAEPLFVDSEELGHLVLAVKDHSAMEIEDVASAVASAIKGIRLLEEANEAKEEVEKAERASAEFFANVSDGLKEPLSSLKDLSEAVDARSRTQYSSALEKVEQLVELSLLEQGGLEMEKSLSSASKLFEGLKGQSWLETDIPETLPALFLDFERVEMALSSYLASLDKTARDAHLSVSLTPSGVDIGITATGFAPSMLSLTTGQLLADKVIIQSGGMVNRSASALCIFLPFPNLFDEYVRERKEGDVLFICEERKLFPPEMNRVKSVSFSSLVQNFSVPSGIAALAFDINSSDPNRAVVLRLLRQSQKTEKLPVLLFGVEECYSSLTAALSLSAGASEKTVLVIGDYPHALLDLSGFASLLCFSSASTLKESGYAASASLIVLQSPDIAPLEEIRADSALSQIPVLFLSDSFSEEEADALSLLPNVLICNTGAGEADEFFSRLVAVICGEPLLPPLTGALVKKAIGYLNRNARVQVSRWQIAESVNISEDYLTRIFHREMGLSPTDYLNRLRIQLAIQELRLTGRTISEVAIRTGFQDQAYFCRVFKKVKGFPPGSVRKRQ
jgi:Transcriptional regulators